MADPLDALRSAAREADGQRTSILDTAADLGTQADAQRAAARTAALNGNGAEFTTASADATALYAQRREVLTGLAGVDAGVAAAVAALVGDPCDLEPDVPLALLPVRLETRYTEDGTGLRVRIFPDDIHVDRLDRGLSDTERAAGIVYWQAIWDGTGDDAAWQTLLASVQPARAEWVAAALAPDLSTRPNPPVPGTLPVLGNPPPRQQLAPVARGLPDRFVVVAVQGGQISRALGNPVPASVVVGLSPNADPADLVQNGAVPFGPGMEWMIDPAVAESIGMLVTVPLPVPNAPVDAVLAVGVRGSLGPPDAAAELAALLDAHRFAEGAAFVRPGTPTNNTETDRAGWTAKAAPLQPITAATLVPADSNAQLAVNALGLSSFADSGMNGWPDAMDTAESVAAAANTALWQATWGTFIERIVAGSFPTPSVGDELRESWRDWWQDQVRGGGPFAALRVGNQPYGVLPVSAVQSSWQPDSGAPIESPLLTVLRNTRSLMAAAVGNVPAVGTGTLDETLLETLGSAPHSIGMRVRSIGSDGLLNALQLMFGIDPGGTDQAAQDQMIETLFLQLGVGAGTLGLRGVIGKRTRPLGLPLVTDDVPDAGVVGDAAFLEALRSDTPRTVASVLQALLDICAAREQRAVDEAAPAELVNQLIDRSVPLLGRDAQRYVQLVNETRQGRIDPAVLHDAASRLDKQFGTAGPATLASLQPIPSTRTSLVDFVMRASLPGQLAQSVAVTALGAWLRASARQAQFWDAAQSLVKADVDQRDYAVAATLDCASHRYDAWVTSLPTARVRQLRGQTPAGLLLGAYGWVEGLTPGATTRPGGYVHAPGLTHAATAGVLRSGYLTHNPDAAGDSTLAIDLSSARVRLATSLLDGVRAGQSLGALIGYLIERGLHEQHLDVYTLSIRSLAPITANRVVADALPPGAQEAIGAGNVVDGVRLLALPRVAIFAKLQTAPADNPYLTPADWPVPDQATEDAINRVLDEAADAYDAVSDVLLAESVHHLVQGNTARAAAAMSAAAGGDTAPVEPDVVRTPTRAAAITHRVLVLFDDTAPGSGGWSATTPRALAEPTLAAWAEDQLGPATAIVLHATDDGTLTTLDVAGISALDVVFDAAAESAALVPPALDARLRALVPALGALPLTATADPAWPVGSRAIGEVAVCARGLLRLISGGRTITPASFARGSDEPVRTSDASMLAGRLAPIVASLATAVTDLTSALANDAAVEDAVTALRAYGIAMPAGAEVAVLAEASKRLAAAQAVTDPDPAAAAQEIGEAVFGPGFVVLPKVSGAADLFGSMLDGVAPARAAIRRWLLGLATVRPDLSAYTAVLLATDATSSAPGPGRSLRVAQLAPSGTAGVTTWLGLSLPDGSPSPDQPVTCVLVDAPTGYGGSAPVTGLVVDDWVEQLPRRNPDGSATITTGVAVNANAPGARAPQAILLAVSPDGGRWSTDRLVAVLDETRELARIRGVTLERLVTPSPILPAIQDQSWSLQGEPTLDLRALVTEVGKLDAVLPYVKEAGP